MFRDNQRIVKKKVYITMKTSAVVEGLWRIDVTLLPLCVIVDPKEESSGRGAVGTTWGWTRPICRWSRRHDPIVPEYSRCCFGAVVSTGRTEKRAQSVVPASGTSVLKSYTLFSQYCNIDYNHSLIVSFKNY